MPDPGAALGSNGKQGSSLRSFASMVRLSHTLFGLPFCLASMVLAHRFANALGGPGLELSKVVWIVLAFTGARTAAMGFNRIADRELDAANPRTATREIPTGTIKVSTAWAFTIAATALFLASAAALGRVPLMLSPICIVVIFGYSLFKRFSWSAHLFLGLALALAPGGAWVAVTGSLEGWPLPLLLMGAVATWVAGFDVIYSLQDEGYDREVGLHSIPVRFGTKGALIISALLHTVTMACLVALHVHAHLSWLHALGVALIGLILVYEHWIVRPDDLSKIGKAFFDLNGYISIAYLACTAGDLFWLST